MERKARPSKLYAMHEMQPEEKLEEILTLVENIQKDVEKIKQKLEVT